jgi:hypothetical protein
MVAARFYRPGGPSLWRLARAASSTGASAEEPSTLPGTAAAQPLRVGVDANFGPPRLSGGSRRLYLVAGVAIVVVILLIVVLVPRGSLNSSSTNSTSNVLAPAGWNAISLPYGQFAAVIFTISSPQVLTGSFLSENLITAYVLNDSAFHTLSTVDTVPGYQWTSGQVWQGSINDTIPAGSWVLVFLNTNVDGSSGVSVSVPVILSNPG